MTVFRQSAAEAGSILRGTQARVLRCPSAVWKHANGDPMKESSPSYVFRAADYERIQAAEELFDPGTKRIIEALGIEPGASCLEVGAGGGAIAGWRRQGVGNDGEGVASDIDLEF